MVSCRDVMSTKYSHQTDSDNLEADVLKSIIRNKKIINNFQLEEAPYLRLCIALLNFVSVLTNIHDSILYSMLEINITGIKEEAKVFWFCDKCQPLTGNIQGVYWTKLE